MKDYCKLLDDVKNSILVGIYEDKDKSIELNYLKDGVTKTVTIIARGAMGLGSIHFWYEISNEPIKTAKIPIELRIDKNPVIKSINILQHKNSYDHYQIVEIQLQHSATFLKLTIKPNDDEENWYEIVQTFDIYKPICQELFSMDSYKKHLSIALRAHGEQKTPHGLPYSFHIVSVATEVICALPNEDLSQEEANIAIACALLHDVLEDTNYDLFSHELDFMIIEGVKALTKDKNLSSKEEQMSDSIARLQKLPKYIQMVKLADRITNLGVPPSHWSKEKMQKYENEARLICSELKSPNGRLNTKLENMINDYKKYYE